MKIYIKIDGGIGRVISATGVVDEFAKLEKEKGNEVSVISSYPQLFNGLPNIDRCYSIMQPFLYEDYISKGEYLEPEPYNNSLYYKDNEHISTVFNHLLTGSKEFIMPKIVLTENELADAKAGVEELRKQHKKKIMLVQPFGSQGGVPTQDGVLGDESYRSFTPKFFNELIDAYKDEYTILSVQSIVTLADGRQVPQVVFKDTIPTTNQDIRKVIAIIPFVDVVVSCDSFLHHAVASLGNPVKTIVLWGGTNEANLGYGEQSNIRSKEVSLFEPNRVPHDRALYVNKNKGCNEFDILKVKEII